MWPRASRCSRRSATAANANISAAARQTCSCSCRPTASVTPRGRPSNLRAFKVAACKLLGRPRGVTEAVGRHEHEHVWRAAADILAFAAVALRLEHRLALGHIAHLAAIAPAFQLHGVLPVSLSFITRTQAMWTSAAARARRDGVDPVALHRFVSGKIDRNVHGRRQPGKLFPEVELGRGLLEPGENDRESST